MAGGERAKGLHDLWPILVNRELDVVMPDVKHCGISELLHIAAAAKISGIGMSPHSPSGPISTAFSAHLCSTIPNLVALEFPFGEAEWRKELMSPEEPRIGGSFYVPHGSGLGMKLNMSVLRSHRVIV